MDGYRRQALNVVCGGLKPFAIVLLEALLIFILAYSPPVEKSKIEGE